MIHIEIEGPTFLSPGDESALFSWLNSIPSVESIVGVGSRIRLAISVKELPDGEPREIVALFSRFKLDASCLRLFKSPKNTEWFYGNTSANWHESIFGK